MIVVNVHVSAYQCVRIHHAQHYEHGSDQEPSRQIQCPTRQCQTLSRTRGLHGDHCVSFASCRKMDRGSRLVADPVSSRDGEQSLGMNQALVVVAAPEMVDVAYR